MVKVLVGKRTGDRFPGFWAEFEGEKVSSYEDTRAEKKIVYTLYRCTAYNYEAYRVHINDESNPENPVYELLPYDPHSVSRGIGWDYSEPWQKEQVAAKYPLFVKDLDILSVRQIDPQPRNVF